MKILGYSERGIINSLIFSIGESPELIEKFIELIDLPETFKLGNPENYTILLEQSFSRFGDADLLIIIHYKKPEAKKVLFIEGKVKTSQRRSWSLVKQFNDYNKYKIEDRYNGYTSNLFFQLYLKNLLIDKWDDINENGFTKEPKYGDIRKIGENEIVKEAFKLISCEEAYFIGLIPSTEKEIKKFKLENETGCHFLSWEVVHEFCKNNEGKLKKVLDIFDYNEGQVY